MDQGVFYVYRIDATSIKLARSRSDLYDGKYVSPSGEVVNNRFIYYPYYQKSISPQKLYRNVVEPIKKDDSYETYTGHTGILINGVEILNYKSGDQIIYGNIKGVDVIKRMIQKAENHLSIIPAGRITDQNIKEIHNAIK